MWKYDRIIFELFLNTNILPEPLLWMIQTDKVSVREDDGKICHAD
jgi:hypothetical protein